MINKNYHLFKLYKLTLRITKHSITRFVDSKGAFGSNTIESLFLIVINNANVKQSTNTQFCRFFNIKLLPIMYTLLIKKDCWIIEVYVWIVMSKLFWETWIFIDPFRKKRTICNLKTYINKGMINCVPSLHVYGNHKKVKHILDAWAIVSRLNGIQNILPRGYR